MEIIEKSTISFTSTFKKYKYVAKRSFNLIAVIKEFNNDSNYVETSEYSINLCFSRVLTDQFISWLIDKDYISRITSETEIEIGVYGTLEQDSFLFLARKDSESLESREEVPIEVKTTEKTKYTSTYKWSIQ